jgi:hypothetical protein
MMEEKGVEQMYSGFVTLHVTDNVLFGALVRYT